MAISMRRIKLVSSRYSAERSAERLEHARHQIQDRITPLIFSRRVKIMTNLGVVASSTPEPRHTSARAAELIDWLVQSGGPHTGEYGELAAALTTAHNRDTRDILLQDQLRQ